MKYKIAYISDGPIKTTYSGAANFIYGQLVKQGFEVIPVEIELPINNWVKIKKSILGRLFKRVLVYKRDELVLNKFARQVEKKIEDVKPDLLFSHYEWILSNVNTNLPMITWPDNCFVDFPNFYSTMRWSNQSVKNGMMQTRRYYEKSSFTIYSSQWAHESCLKNGLCSDKKSCYIPYGENVDPRPSKNDVMALIKGRAAGNLNFVWVGVDVKRKGLLKAIAIVNKLNELNTPAILHIVGVSKPIDVGVTENLLQNCILHGKLNKNIPEQYDIYRSLLSKCHFVLAPTNADCTPMIVAEANAFGVPVLSHDIGGLKSLIVHGKNGAIFPLSDAIDEYIEFILRFLRSENLYEQLAIDSFNEVENRLNWNKSGKEVAEIIYKTLKPSMTNEI